MDTAPPGQRKFLVTTMSSFFVIFLTVHCNVSVVEQPEIADNIAEELEISLHELEDAGRVDSESEIATDSVSGRDISSCVDDTTEPECEGCLIDSVCYADGEPNPLNVCQVCTISESPSSWSIRPDGSSCDDNYFCNGAETCRSGQCSERDSAPSCDDGLFCNGTEFCHPDLDRCVSPGQLCTVGEVCFERSGGQCCIPEISSNCLDGDLVVLDSCGQETRIECADTLLNGLCLEGHCGCAEGWTGEGCDRCLIYVNQANGDDNHSGTRWQEAMATVSAGLTRAGAGGCAVWVAGGRYTPDLTGLDDLKFATFSLMEGVDLYGGFEGSEHFLEARRLDNNPTVLSGDLNGDDLPEGVNIEDNVFHVVTGADNSTLDGFVISGGHAIEENNPELRGGGMLNIEASPIIANCIFEHNSAHLYGGAIANERSSPVIVNCTFQNNSTTFPDEDSMTRGLGGAIFNKHSAPIIDDCLFQHNHASNQGGAIFSEGSEEEPGRSKISNTVFRYNTSGYRAGAIKNVYSHPKIVNSLFYNNHADWRGGALYSYHSDAHIINCTFYGNTAGETCGGSVNHSSHIIFENSIFWGNRDENENVWDNQIFISNSSDSTTIKNSLLEGGCPEEGESTEECVEIISANPLFRNILEENFRVQSGSLVIDNGSRVNLLPDVVTDLDHLPRFVGPAVDLGAYEHQNPFP